MGKEDVVEPGKPNAAGWLLPNATNIHRRYPEVAIFIPDSMGRACGGLCALCQRMYDFQKGHLNFNLDRLKPTDGWEVKMERLMMYYEHDSQMQDILITGGCTDESESDVGKILDLYFPNGRAQARIEQTTGERRKICRDSTGEIGFEIVGLSAQSCK